MISAGDFKNGITVEIDGNIYQILEFQHVKPGKGAAFVRTKLKNIISGGAVERTFRPTEKFPKAHIDRKDMQYLYQDGDLYNFMDVETYEMYFLLNRRFLSSWRLQKQSRDLRAILHREQRNRLL